MAEFKTLGELTNEIKLRKELFSEKCAAESATVISEISQVQFVTDSLADTRSNKVLKEIPKVLNDLKTNFEKNIQFWKTVTEKRLKHCLVMYAGQLNLLENAQVHAKIDQSKGFLELLAVIEKSVADIGASLAEIIVLAEQGLKVFVDGTMEAVNSIREAHVEVFFGQV